MPQRTVVQTTGLQLSNLAEPRTVEITKPERGQSIPVELDDNHSTKFDLSAVADENMTFVHAGTKLVIQFDNQSTVVADPFFDRASLFPISISNYAAGAASPVSNSRSFFRKP